MCVAGLIIGNVSLFLGLISSLVFLIFSITLFGLLSNPDDSATVRNSCVISSPLRCQVISIDSNEIKIAIANSGSDGVSLKSLEISNCSSLQLSNIIRSKENSIFKVSCNLNRNSFFRSEIILSYSMVDSKLLRFSSGTISGLVQ